MFWVILRATWIWNPWGCVIALGIWLAAIVLLVLHVIIYGPETTSYGADKDIRDTLVLSNLIIPTLIGGFILVVWGAALGYFSHPADPVSGWIVDRQVTLEYTTRDCKMVGKIYTCHNNNHPSLNKFVLRKCDSNNLCEYTQIEVDKNIYDQYEIGQFYPKEQ